jgi:hypothetical protein
MRHTTTSVTCFLVLLSGCGGTPEGSDPSAPEQTGQVSQALIATLGPFDPRFSYQGQYQIDDCNGFFADEVNNDAWGLGQSCPATAGIPEGRAKMPEDGCGGNQYLCEQQAFSFANSLKLGGMFQIDDCGGVDTIGNTFNNGAVSCPRGFVQDRMGRIRAPESGCGAWQYVCDARPGEAGGHTFMSGTDLGLNTLRWGGQYQLDDCRGNNRVNPLTGNFTCPSGYTAIRYGRVLGPESGCGVNQSVCVGMEPH